MHGGNTILSNKKLTQSGALTSPLSKLGEILEGGEVSASDWVSFLFLFKFAFLLCVCYPVNLQTTGLQCARNLKEPTGREVPPFGLSLNVRLYPGALLGLLKYL